MKFKNVDILISRRLPSIIPTNEIIFEDRLNSTGGTDLPTSELPLIIKEFFTQNQVLNYDKFPEQIINAIREFNTKDNKDITTGDLQDLFSLFDYLGFPFKLIQRIDLDEPTELPDTTQRSYLISNFISNTSMTCGVYTGYARNYDNKTVPVAADFMDIFNFSEELISRFGLDVSMKTYELFKKQDNLKNYNDAYIIQFFRSRGLKYVIERSII